MKHPLIFLLVVWSALLTGQSDLIRLDGRFDDWQSIPFISRSEGSGLRILELAATNDETYLYLRIRLNREIGLQDSEVQIWIDGDDDPNTGTPLHGIGGDFNYHFGEKNGVSQGQFIAQNDIGLVSLPTHTSEHFELRLRRGAISRLGRNLFTADTLRIVIGLSAFPSDQLPQEGAFSYAFVKGPFPSYNPVPLQRPDSTDFRLATYNVLDDRPLDDLYQPAFIRIVKALNADIFCFDEFFDGTAEQVKAILDEALPGTDHNGWYVSKLDPDNITASRFPIKTAIRVSFEGNISANLITLSGTKDLLVINCHLSCCDQDDLRQLQVDAVTAFIEEVKTPGGRLTLQPNTPIIVAGDMNLVGYRQQLHTLLNGNIQNTGTYGTAGYPDWDDSELEDLQPFHNYDPISTTWRNAESFFTPGRLDYILYTGSAVQAVNAYVMVSDALSTEDRSILGLQPDDTDMSDHYPLVGDFQMQKSAVTGNRKLMNRTDFILSPNPTFDKVRIQLPAGWEKQTSQFFWYTAEGRLLGSCSTNASEVQLSLQDFPPGIYLLEGKTKGETLRTKVIKQ